MAKQAPKVVKSKIGTQRPVEEVLSLSIFLDPVLGEKMPDGTVFAGISPETNQPMYATPADAPLNLSRLLSIDRIG
ncbi:MAG TPA: hypothetical protein VE959_16140 [Bryobacteraceae bacterium]|nr:hypothetical protein [Bryobacteraceae bacterium]